MPNWTVRAAVLASSLFSACSVLGQVPAPSASARAEKKIELTRPPAENPEERDGRLGDAKVLAYVQDIAGRVARASGVKELNVHITHARGWYARLAEPDLVYLSGGLLQRVESEAELAGLLAHLSAHAHPAAPVSAQGAGAAPAPPACILAAPAAPAQPAEELRGAEITASQAGLKTLRSAGYAPTAMLDVLSKLAYEQPAWGKAIVSEDLMRLRRVVESEPLPLTGYIMDSSEFPEQHARVATALERPAPKPVLRPAPPPPM